MAAPRRTLTVPSQGERVFSQKADATSASGRGGIYWESVAITDNSAGIQLKKTLPPRSVVRYASVKNETAVAVDGTPASGTASNGYVLVATATTGAATEAGVLSFVSGASTAIDADAGFGGASSTIAGVSNATSSDLNLFLMPIGDGATAPFDVARLFNGAATIKVMLDIDEYPAMPNA